MPSVRCCPLFTCHCEPSGRRAELSDARRRCRLAAGAVGSARHSQPGLAENTSANPSPLTRKTPGVYIGQHVGQDRCQADDKDDRDYCQVAQQSQQSCSASLFSLIVGQNSWASRQIATSATKMPRNAA